MLQKILAKVFGSKVERDEKRFQPLVEEINQREPEIQRLSDQQLRSKTPYFREKLDAGASLDELLPEAFAVVREAAVRTLKQRHYDVQLMGGVALHHGGIAEMKTGEGKTLTSTLPIYLNALLGKGVHVATVNDYLASRDAEWMGRIYDFLGLSVGLTLGNMSYEEKRMAYKVDITYGVNSEYGFDFLRDNKAGSLEEKVQSTGHHYAILDEVDSILIDEARNPLILSDPHGEPVELYRKISGVVKQLKEGQHHELDDKASKRGTVALTEEGVEEVERRLGDALLGGAELYDHTNMDIVHHVNQALVAQNLYHRDVDYLVQDRQVVLVDEFTGRIQPDRRLSDGLHQAIEAKENAVIVNESQTVARITYQHYFRMYEKLAGMTGTAETESAEFAHTYKLDVVVVPTNEPMIRIDHPDQIYGNEEVKFQAIIDEVIVQHEQGRPVLVGTIDIEKSEKLSKMLKKERRSIRHQVLNAKEHHREAEIIAQAGMPGAVTIATNMAGRGVDILLGGNPEGMAKDILRKEKIPLGTLDEDSEERKAAYAEAEAICNENREAILKAGGLHIIGTERHDSRRIDNQLRGRSGRQGDPGSSRFYLSLEDDLMRKFGSERLQGMMNSVGMDKDVPIEHPWVTRAIEKAQKRVEDRHFDLRKELLKRDDVMHTQRHTIYELRDGILEDEDHKEIVWEMIENTVDDHLEEYLPSESHSEEWDVEGLTHWLTRVFLMDIDNWQTKPEQMTRPECREKILKVLDEAYQQRETEMGAETMRSLERLLLLSRIDSQWRDHLQTIDYIEEGIYLRGYGGKDPIVVFKNESYGIFEAMYRRIEEEVSEYIFKAQFVEETPERAKTRRTRRRPMPRPRSPLPQQIGEDTLAPAGSASQQPIGNLPKVGRNAPCPCGSGKKYKRCHGR
jgi:preprotein translocase subunit SecA